jgi:hypothetical protein
VVGQFFKGHEMVLPTEPDCGIDRRMVAATGKPLVIALKRMSPQMAFSLVQTETLGIAQGKMGQVCVRYSMHGQSGLEVFFGHLDIPGPAPIAGAGLFAAFCDRLNAIMSGHGAPTADPDSFDDDVRVHEDDLFVHHAGAPVS